MSDTIPPTQPTYGIELGHSSGREPDIITEASITPGVLEQQQHEDVDARTWSLNETLCDNP